MEWMRRQVLPVVPGYMSPVSASVGNPIATSPSSQPRCRRRAEEAAAPRREPILEKWRTQHHSRLPQLGAPQGSPGLLRASQERGGGRVQGTRKQNKQANQVTVIRSSYHPRFQRLTDFLSVWIRVLQQCDYNKTGSLYIQTLMERPVKRRKVSPAPQITPTMSAGNTDGNPLAMDPALGENDLVDKHFLHAAISKASRASLPRPGRNSPLLAEQRKLKLQRLHPRGLVPHQAPNSIVPPVMQPVQTAVASFINVVLDNGGTSVGNVLVPAESTVFNLNGYGPITIDKSPPPNATPSPEQQNSPPNPPPPATESQPNSHAPQQTPQPVPQSNPQPASTAVPSPPEQSPMSIQVPGSSSQIILSSPPTPLPPSPSNTTTTASGTESYFGSTSSQTSSSSTQTTAASSTSSSSAITTSSQPPQSSNSAFIPTAGNLTTSAIISTEVVSGSTRTATIPITTIGITNSSLTTSSRTSTPFSSLTQVSSTTPFSSTFMTSTRSSIVTPSTTSSTLSSSISSSSASASGTSQDGIIPGGIGGPTGTAGAPPASSSTAAAGSSEGNTPSTPTLVGSVVGGVAGLTLILLLLLFFLRRRRRIGQQRTISPPVPQSASTGPGANTGTMTERSSAAVPLAGAGFFRRLRPGSGATTATTETTASERGFQNLGGRKLESVLYSNGDGYGNVPFGTAGAAAAAGPSSAGGPPPGSIPIVTGAPGAVPGHSTPESLSGSSFYRDSQGFYGGQGQPPPEPEPPSNSSSMFVGPGSPPQSPTQPQPSTSPPSQEGVAVTRPGPARTPVITQPGGLSPLRGSPRQQRGTPPPPQIPGTIQERPRDGLGRSHPSMDGSRSSRFAENI
ncbi:MAG: hypothetical protein Q9219_003116 [cf. Caloplaca sp. 3 TL-2023]